MMQFASHAVNTAAGAVGIGPSPDKSPAKAQHRRTPSSNAGHSPKTRLQLDKTWDVGGRYQVARGPVPIVRAPGDSSFIGSLSCEDTVLLLGVRRHPPSGPWYGLVFLPGSDDTGWIPLEGLPDVGTVTKVKLSESWTVGGRYLVFSEATVREDREVSSKKIHALRAGEEVLALELATTIDEEACRARLRLRISTDRGVIGWISPISMRGQLLLQQVNMLSAMVCENRLALPQSRTIASTLFRGIGGGGPGNSPRLSPRVGTLPWAPGCQYRVIEATKMREGPSLKSKEKCRVPVGVLVTVHAVDISQVGQCPVVHVTLKVAGPDDGRVGWVRCINQEGCDVLDVRDQLQFAKVMHKLEAQRLVAERVKKETEAETARAAEAAAAVPPAAPQSTAPKSSEQRAEAALTAPAAVLAPAAVPTAAATPAEAAKPTPTAGSAPGAVSAAPAAAPGPAVPSTTPAAGSSGVAAASPSLATGAAPSASATMGAATTAPSEKPTNASSTTPPGDCEVVKTAEPVPQQSEDVLSAVLDASFELVTAGVWVAAAASVLLWETLRPCMAGCCFVVGPAIPREVRTPPADGSPQSSLKDGSCESDTPPAMAAARAAALAEQEAVWRRLEALQKLREERPQESFQSWAKCHVPPPPLPPPTAFANGEEVVPLWPGKGAQSNALVG